MKKRQQATMLQRYLCTLLTILFFLGLSASAQTSSPQQFPEISFTVSMPRPHTHLLEVEMHLKRPAGMPVPAEERIVMPVWTPGSYMIREFARHVQDFAATGAGGQTLKWEKIDKDTWRIATGGAPEWKVTYRVYANELSVRTNELNSDHAFWNNAALLMYPEGLLEAPSTVRILAPQSWSVATGLPAVPGAKNTFHADNFDILYDSPVEASNFKTISFTVKGVPHRIVIDGEGNYNPERLRLDVQKIVATEVEIMGGEVPYKDYTFILHLRSRSDGLEHLNSTALGYPRFGFSVGQGDRLSSASPNVSASDEPDYHGFLSLVAHEFFHLWNVKRIRPDALGPFDYKKENYTKLLWVAEGITDYYAELALRRAGLVSEKDFLAAAAKAIRTMQNTPGRLEQSAEEASFDAWIKFYRQDENSVNSQVSYYDKGAILGMLLDLQIREQSRGTKSLDDVMRFLYSEFFKKDRNYTPEDFQKICETMAGSSLDQFFSKYVRGRDELDYNDAFEAAGLRLETNTASNAGTLEKPYFGADLAQEVDRLIVKRVYAGSPAYQQGLNAGDQIVALNNMRVNKDFFDARLAEKKPGDLLTLTIFRSDDLSTLIIKLGNRIDPAYRIVQIDKPSDLQQSIYQSWLGAYSTK